MELHAAAESDQQRNTRVDADDDEGRPHSTGHVQAEYKHQSGNGSESASHAEQPGEYTDQQTDDGPPEQPAPPSPLHGMHVTLLPDCHARFPPHRYRNDQGNDCERGEQHLLTEVRGQQ